MPQPTLTLRVTGLEARMDDVERRGERMERELKAFRQEFATSRGEVQQEFANVWKEIAAFRVEVQQQFADVRQEFVAVRTEMTTLGETLRHEIRDGDEETRRYTRELHEDLVERISTLGNGTRPPKRRRGSRKG